MNSPRDIMLPPSLNMMRGREGWQEGIYASLNHSRSGRSPLQNDLELTLFPGSQIQQADERSLEAANSGGRLFDQTTTLSEDFNKSCGDEELLLQDSKQSKSGQGNGCSYDVVPDNNWDMRQTLAWIDERRTSLAEKELQAAEWNERLSSHRDLLQHAIRSRSRYGHRVRVSKNAPHGYSDEVSYKRRKTEVTGSVPLKTDRPVIDRASSTDHCAVPPPPTTARYPQHSPPLSPTRGKKLSPKSLTSLYPSRLKETSPSHKQSTAQLLSATTSDMENSQSVVSQETVNISRDEIYKQMQTELKQTKLELHAKMKAESDAQQMIDDLQKAYNDLRTSTDSFAGLPKAHSSLLLEYRQVLSMYHSLAHKHSACRGPSSKKLARRILESQSLSNDSGYASRSPSLATPPSFATNSGADTGNNCMYHGSPLIDLTSSDTSAPLLAATYPTPDSTHGNSVAEQYEHITPQNNFNPDHDDASYANINGFDEEANELFNALWEQEMASWNAEEGVEQGP